MRAFCRCHLLQRGALSGSPHILSRSEKYLDKVRLLGSVPGIGTLSAMETRWSSYRRWKGIGVGMTWLPILG
jgi:hypothetical protein